MRHANIQYTKKKYLARGKSTVILGPALGETFKIYLSDPYPAFFLLIATTSNKIFLKVQKL